MEQHEEANRSFGLYLRKVREGRRLSLDAVEELSAGYVERVTKSHLSRIENGQATPSFTRLYALSRIYGVPVSSLAERFEVALRRQHAPATESSKPIPEVLASAHRLREGGRYIEALAAYESVLDRLADGESGPDPGSEIDLRIHRINCFIHLGSHGLAKDECEGLLGSKQLSPDRRLLVLESFVICCVNLERFAVAMMALEQAERDLDALGAPAKLEADLAAIRGKILLITGFAGQASTWYQKAISLYDQIGDAFETCRCEVSRGYALVESGETAQARECLSRALKTAEAASYDRQQALALNNLALLSFREGDLVAAESYALRSNSIARQREYTSLVFCNCYYLWRIAQAKGDEAGARVNERALRAYVTRVEGYIPEVQEFRAYLVGEGV